MLDDPSAGPDERTAGLSRFREQARQAASANRELGLPVERAGFARPSVDAVFGDWRPRARGRRRVPVHFQLQATDCGPASLMMALRSCCPR